MIKGHGDDIHQYQNIRINFSSNVYNHLDHEGLFCYLANELDRVVNYPEPTPSKLEGELASLLNLTAEEVMVTSGATEAIYLIAQTWRRGKSWVLMPTFSEYADACRVHEHQICNLYDLDNLPADAELVWLCNPNNPTGTVIEQERLEKVITSYPDTLWIIDASYAPFTREPLFTAHQAATWPNVLMLHSMTKEYAIPGLRLGYITGRAPLLEKLRRQRMPWSVNQVALQAGHYLLSHPEEFEIPLDELLAERQRLAHRLTQLGVVEVWPSDTHILLCLLRMGKAEDLKEYLATEWGILIRNASNFEGLDTSYFRIAVQSPEEDDELINGITEWLAL